ncbi:MAG: hypothetical protein M3Y50_06310 [Acidobacteriota bacterium]|nr:hypothetical protein [Acidobacteriota bacterium]
MRRDRLSCLLIPLAALIAISPLLLRGCSCGHDFDFHLISWMEAARQFTSGNLHPQWAYTPAFNAGEPRFVFYPPASWTLGAILGLLFPWSWVPILYTWLALTGSGYALYRVARALASPSTALVAAVVYTVNPYMLFTAYERTAYAELLAAAFIPLLLHGILRPQLTIPSIAIPVALLWITNAPAAVMSCYGLALLAIVRLATTWWNSSSAINNPQGTPQNASTLPTRSAHAASISARYFRLRQGSRHGATALVQSSLPLQPLLQEARTILAGTSLGLGLAAFYVLPAAFERRFVQIGLALVPGMRIEDNFLFHHTGDLDHDAVLHTASLIAALLIVATISALAAARRVQKKSGSYKAPQPETPYLGPGTRPSSKSGHPDERIHIRSEQAQHSFSPETSPLTPAPLTKHLPFTPFSIVNALAVLTAAIAILLTPITAFLWRHIPELAFLQFPWRLLAILAAVLSLSIGLALTRLPRRPALTAALAISIATCLTWPAYIAFHQPCDQEDSVSSRIALFHSPQGIEPTDEYTPITADNDSLAQNNPPWWLSPNPNAKAGVGAPAGPAPTLLTFNSPAAQTLILNLRDYPSWRVTLNQSLISNRQQRDDGLIALAIPAGSSTVRIAYTRTFDRTLGDIITITSLLALATAYKTGRRRRH